MNYQIYLEQTRDLLGSPSEYFRSWDRANSFRFMLRTALLLLAVSTALLFFAALANLSVLREAGLAMERALPGFQSGGFAKTVPWNRIFFAVFWLNAMLLVGFSRHLTVMLLGEKDRALATTQAITFAGFLPGIVMLTISGLIATFFPVVPGAVQSGGVRFSIWVSLMAVLLTFVFDARICISGFKAVYAQNTGRAVLTWLSPILILGFACFVLYGLFILLLIVVR
ncbi:MAG: hypothetical protein JNM27_19075 [Leptospirales bacterium]|nr:hypothetical protein [Leptospirales bacterium]